MVLRGRSTGQLDQMGFHPPIELALQRSLCGIVAVQGRLQSLLHKALFDADHGSWTDDQYLNDLTAGPVLLVTFVDFEQHAGGHLLMGHGFAGMNEAMPLLLLWAERDGVAFFVHGWSPLWLFPQFLLCSPLRQF
jgi:hypothetical protein